MEFLFKNFETRDFKSSPFRSLFIILLTYGFGLWWYSVPFTGDEKVYISTAMEMWQRKSWLTPYLFGEPSYFKPPFQYWVTLLSWHLLGFNNFATYFPSIVATLGTAWNINKMKQLLFAQNPPQSNQTAGLWFAACTGTLTYGLSAQMEIWIVFFATWIQVLFLFFFKTRQWRWLYLALFFSGLSALVKSPLYSVFSVLTFWLVLLLQKETRFFRNKHFIFSLLLGIGTGVTWFVIIFMKDKDRFWSQYILSETIAKRGGNSSSIAHMWFDYLTFCAPLILFIPSAAIRFFKAGIDLARDPSLDKKFAFQFLLATAVIPALFFTAFPYRTETYLYILIPTFVLGIDLTLDYYGKKITSATHWVSKINGIFMAFLMGTLGILLWLGGLIPLYLVLLLGITSLIFFHFSWKFNGHAMALASLAILFCVKLTAISLGQTDFQPLEKILVSLKERPVQFYNPGKTIWNEVGLFAVALGHPLGLSYSLEDATRLLEANGALILNDAQSEEVLPRLNAQTYSRGQHLKAVPWKRMKRPFQIPSLQDIFQIKDRNRDQKAWEERYFKVYHVVTLD